MHDPVANRNPYESPRSDELGQSADSARMPRFCSVMFALSLAFCIVRIPILLGAAVATLAFAIFAQFPWPWCGVYLSGIFLITLGEGGGVFCGIPANIGMFRRREFGVQLGYWGAAAEIPLLLGLFTLLAVDFREMADEDPIALLVFSGIGLFRLLFLAAYVTALQMFSRWMREAVW